MKKLISIIIPVLNEEDNIFPLYNKLITLSEKFAYDFEFIFVNDGSKDHTWERIEKISTDKRVRGILFTRNFGHPNALQAGLEKARGDAVITMDGDLQHPVEIVPELIEMWEEGYKIVNTIRQDTNETGVLKKNTSHFFLQPHELFLFGKN